MPDTPDFSARFPAVRSHAYCKLLSWHPTGVLDNERADNVTDFLESEENSGDEPFHRFTDMDGFTRISLGLDHVVRIARRRRRYTGPPVKSAFFASRPVGVIIAQMYEELMDGSLIQVCTFRDRAAAAAWLGVPGHVLEPPPGRDDEPPPEEEFAA